MLSPLYQFTSKADATCTPEALESGEMLVYLPSTSSWQRRAGYGGVFVLDYTVSCQQGLVYRYLPINQINPGSLLPSLMFPCKLEEKRARPGDTHAFNARSKET